MDSSVAHTPATNRNRRHSVAVGKTIAQVWTETLALPQPHLTICLGGGLLTEELEREFSRIILHAKMHGDMEL